MSTLLTLFKGTLVQDSALSVSGLDRDSTSDHPLALVDGKPVMVGRGLKGAAVAMAKRFFAPLPRAVSDEVSHGALRRSVWEFEDLHLDITPKIVTRAGVGIRQKTGARASGILFDKEVIAAGTEWELTLRVQWSYALNEEEAREAEGILGYVLSEHWAQGRCWLGAGVARGLGWCTLKDLKAYRLNAKGYDTWVLGGRQAKDLPPALKAIPTVQPTRDWVFETLKAKIAFGDYQQQGQDNWGLDMFALGAHASAQGLQATANGRWATPPWANQVPDAIETDRAILMEGTRPLLPGSSLRGPLRHALSRQLRMQGQEVLDPHLVQGKVGLEDPAGQIFGSIEQSSHVLIRDSIAEADWRAAKLHMHAEDEFSAGSYGTAKREAIRLLRATFPVHLVIEGPSADAIAPLKEAIKRQVRLGELGHLGLGGHKSRGAGWGTWKDITWIPLEVKAQRTWSQPKAEDSASVKAPLGEFEDSGKAQEVFLNEAFSLLSQEVLTLAQASELAKAALGENSLVAWWCEPSIDFSVTRAPQVFGEDWPQDHGLKVDEVAFFGAQSVWRVAKTSQGFQVVHLWEDSQGPHKVRASIRAVRLHDFERFEAHRTGRAHLRMREWYQGESCLGFTLTKGGK